jgi:hypothetical protein
MLPFCNYLSRALADGIVNRMIPKINIIHGKLLEPFFNCYVEKHYPDYEFKSDEEVKEKIELFRKEGQKNSDKILNAICEVTKKTFLSEKLDVYVVNATPKDMSAPIIIRSRYTPEEFIDSLIHELLHVFLRENKIMQYKTDIDVDMTTKNHIDVFAILTHIYKNVLKDEQRLEKIKEKSNTPQNLSYKKAWDIVEKIGYKKIIETITQQ